MAAVWVPPLVLYIKISDVDINEFILRLYNLTCHSQFICLLIIVIKLNWFPIPKIEIKLKMQFSKNKGSCAYASNKSKTKPKISAPIIQMENDLPKENQLRESLYEELMNQLQIQDSQYIEKLLQKNDQKMERKNVSKTKNTTKVINQSSCKKDDHQTRNRSRGQSNHSNNFNLTVKPGEVFNQQRSKKQQHRRVHEGSQCSQKSSTNSYFLTCIDEYLSSLNTQDKSEALTRKQSRNDRQFRKTIQITQKLRYEPTISIPTSKYQKLLTKLEESLMKNDRLQSELQARDYKIREMKLLIKSMYSQIHELSSQLQQEKMQKEKYSSMLQQFASKVRSVRHSSKQKHYLPTHSKRNSYVPPTVNSYTREDYFNSTDLNSILYDDTNKYELKKKEAVLLKKKSKAHQGRMNENYMEPVEGRWPCDSASIYNDRSSRTEGI